MQSSRTLSGWHLNAHRTNRIVSGTKHICTPHHPQRHSAIRPNDIRRSRAERSNCADTSSWGLAQCLRNLQCMNDCFVFGNTQVRKQNTYILVEYTQMAMKHYTRSDVVPAQTHGFTLMTRSCLAPITHVLLRTWM